MVHKEVLAHITDPALRVYVIWVPILNGDTPTAAARAAADLPRDPRVTHYWDDNRALATTLGARLAIPKGAVAWDVYLLYPRDATLPDDAPPLPARWMSQLDDVPPSQAPALDGPLLRRWVEESLAAR